MVKMTISSFLQALAEHNLLNEDQLAEIRQAPLAKGDDLKALARVLVEKKWLTPYQAQQVLQGNGQGLNLGPYLLLDLIGKGGMGEVFRAQHRTMDRIVALKVMKQERMATPGAVKRFHREMKSLAQLVHPNVVIAYDAGQDEDTHYFAMEYVEGTNLNRLVKQSGPLPLAQACEVIRQAALGLQAAHECGIIHRDIKPANLLVSAVGDRPSAIGQESAKAALGPIADSRQPTAVVKILDLGLALCKEHGSQQTVLTKLGTVLGTPEYLSPEQALNSSTVDGRADLYSLGCTLFYLLAGRPPFQSDVLPDLLLQHTTEAPPAITKFRPEVPEDLQKLLARLLAKRPEDRLQTAAAVAEALVPFCAADRATGTVAQEEKPTPSTEPPAPAQSEAESEPTIPRRDREFRRLALKKMMPGLRRSPVAVGLLAFAGTLLLGGVTIALLSQRESDPDPVVAQVENSTPPAEKKQEQTPPLKTKPLSQPAFKPSRPSNLEPKPKAVIELRPEPKTKLKPEFVPDPQPEKTEPKPQPKEEAKPEPKPVMKKHPVPNAETVLNLEAIIRKENKAWYASKARTEKKKLVDQLFGEADQSQDQPARRYVLLREASDQAAQAGLVEEAWEALVKIEAGYAIDNGLEQKFKALEKAAPKSQPTPLAKIAQALAEELIEEDKFESALKSPALGDKAARQLPRNIDMVTEFQARIREVKELFQEAAEQEALKKAKALLQEDADDPQANTILGKYLCLRKGNWEDGLSLLAKGNDPKLKDIAQKEEEEKKNPAALEKLADSWQSLGKKEGPYRVSILERARYWYDQALGQLPDKDKPRVQSRIKGIDKLLSGDEAAAKTRESFVRTLDCEKAIKHAQHYFGQGRFGEAAKALKAAADATQDETSKEKIMPFLLFAGKMSAAQKAALKGKYGESAQLFDEAGELAPDKTTGNFAKYLYHVATAWRATQAGKRTEAQLAYDAAKKVLPSIQARNTLRCSCQ